jgi:hypothetical protein
VSKTGEEIKPLVLRLVIAVMALDVIAITLYTVLHIDQRSSNVRYAYGAVWVVSTLVVVLRALARIREIRVRNRRAARQ